MKRTRSSEPFGSMADQILKGSATNAFNKNFNRRKPEKIRKPAPPPVPKVYRSKRDSFSDSSEYENYGIENYKVKLESEVKEHFKTKNVLVSIMQSLMITTFVMIILKYLNPFSYNIISHLVMNPEVFIKNFSKKIINK